MVLLAFIGAAACSGSVSGVTATLTPNRMPVVAIPPELARFNEFLAELTGRLKDSLVYVQAGRSVADGPTRSGDSRSSAGSGFVVDPSGIIVTTAHVVDGAASVHVRLSDGRRFSARVIGRDTRVDLALLKIEGAVHLAALPLGDSHRVRVGEFVLALGHPFGLEQSVSFGIVGRKGPALTGAPAGFDLIQTDASINPGNSGGPLVTMAGEVVGVTTTAARNGALGFAIPANLVKMLLPHLLERGRMDWGWLGVTIADVGDDDLERLNLREARGVVIRDVMPGEPADKAGLRPDDVIVAVGGTRVDTPRDVQRVVSMTSPGKRLRIVLLRNGHHTEFEVTVGLQKEPGPPTWGTRKGAEHAFSPDRDHRPAWSAARVGHLLESGQAHRAARAQMRGLSHVPSDRAGQSVLPTTVFRDFFLQDSRLHRIASPPLSWEQ